MMEELKPCPFCGGEAELKLIPNYFTQGLSSNGWAIECTRCHCTQTPHMSDHDAVEDWNERKPE